MRRHLEPLGRACAIVLGIALAVAAFTTSSATTGATPADALAATPPAGGRPVLGAAVNPELLRGGGSYERVFRSHFASLTPENAMKMDALAPTPGGLALDPADELVTWARARGIAVHGHALVWHRQLPPWLTARTWTRAELRRWLETYVRTVVGHFRGRVGSWDVVNEPLGDDGTLRDSIWLRVLGPGYVADVLRWAHEADPTARLLVNDFNVDRSGSKADGMVALARDLLRRGASLHAVGLQAHFTRTWHPPAGDLEATMRRYAELGLGVEISELDVALGDQAGAPSSLAEQAEIFRATAAACRALPACGRLTTWGFTDASTWLGTNQRPLPFAADYSAKPAWRALAAGLGR